MKQNSTIYFDPQCGVSGDMFAGALLDILQQYDKAVFAQLTEAVDSLGLGVTLTLADVTSGGIRASKFDVLDSHSTQPVEQVHEHEHAVHRHLADIVQIIESAKLTEAVKADSIAVFELIATAEARVHGTSKDHVHFHEVGAVDAIVDVIAGAWLFDKLAAKGFCGAINLGSGFVNCQHGRLAVPVPAVVELLTGMPAYTDPSIPTELATPTGVALLKHFTSEYGAMPQMTVFSSGYGAGTKQLTKANIFRVIMGDLC